MAIITRNPIWETVGTTINSGYDVESVLEEAGLNWTVEKKPIQVVWGKKIPDYVANVRSSDGKVLGVVGTKYVIVQNITAFKFLNELLQRGCQIEKSGTFAGGKKVWILVKLETFEVLGDEVQNYILVVNSFDGSGSVKICVTPIRVWCQNKINIAFRKAKSTYSLRHTTNVETRIDLIAQAQDVLGIAHEYTVRLSEFAEELAKKEVDDFQLKSILNGLFPVTEKSSELQKRRAEESKEAFYICYAAPDLDRFRGTAWGVVNAVADLVDHSLPHKNTANYAENNFAKSAEGHPLLNKVVRMVG